MRMRTSLTIVVLLMPFAVMAGNGAHANDAALVHSELKARTFELAEKYFEQFQHPRTFVL